LIIRFPCKRHDLDILRHPPDALAVTYGRHTTVSPIPNRIPLQGNGRLTLPHDNTTHENLDRPDPLERHLALPRRLVQAQLVPQLVLGHRVRVVDLVAEDQEGDLGEIFHGQEGVQFGFGFCEAFVVLGVDEEDDAADFGEVVFPEAAGCGEKISGLAFVRVGRGWR